MTIAAAVAKKLLQIKAIKLSPQNPFTWASGIKSPIYCDNRIVLSHPSVRDFLKESLVHKAADFASFDNLYFFNTRRMNREDFFHPNSGNYFSYSNCR